MIKLSCQDLWLKVPHKQHLSVDNLYLETSKVSSGYTSLMSADDIIKYITFVISG